MTDRKLSIADVINAGRSRVIPFPSRADLALTADRSVSFTQWVGSLMLSGEKRPDGSAYDQSPEDAVKTLAMVIRGARELCTPNTQGEAR